MNKVYKLLHKKLDQKVEKNKEIIKRKSAIEKAFKEDKVEYVDKDVFDYYRNEIVYRGIHNKKAIEDAYFQGMVKMQDYFEHLDFNEKKRLMNYEIEQCLADLIHFEYEETTIFIPFFDEKMNRIYKNDMVLFDLKQYHRIVRDYSDLYQKDYYGLKAYQSAFSSLDVIGQYKDKVSMYDPYTNRLFFLENLELIEFITLTNSEDECLQNLSLAYFYENDNQLVDVLESTGNINEKIAKKARKYLSRK